MRPRPPPGRASRFAVASAASARWCSARADSSARSACPAARRRSARSPSGSGGGRTETVCAQTGQSSPSVSAGRRTAARSARSAAASAARAWSRWRRASSRVLPRLPPPPPRPPGGPPRRLLSRRGPAARAAWSRRACSSGSRSGAPASVARAFSSASSADVELPVPRGQRGVRVVAPRGQVVEAVRKPRRRERVPVRDECRHGGRRGGRRGRGRLVRGARLLLGGRGGAHRGRRRRRRPTRRRPAPRRGRGGRRRAGRARRGAPVPVPARPGPGPRPGRAGGGVGSLRLVGPPEGRLGPPGVPGPACVQLGDPVRNGQPGQRRPLRGRRGGRRLRAAPARSRWPRQLRDDLADPRLQRLGPARPAGPPPPRPPRCRRRSAPAARRARPRAAAARPPRCSRGA